MGIHYRLFGKEEAAPEPAALLAHLEGRGLPVSGSFTADEGGWWRGELAVAGEVLVLERFLAAEEGVRAELNGWAGWLETCEHARPRNVELMERVIQSRQLITLEWPGEQDEELLDRVCREVCQFLSQAIDGFYQQDGVGFVSREGEVWVAEG